MPQLYPLMWMLMMPISILTLYFYLILFFYMKKQNYFEMKSMLFYKSKILWEW